MLQQAYQYGVYILKFRSLLLPNLSFNGSLQYLKQGLVLGPGSDRQPYTGYFQALKVGAVSYQYSLPAHSVHKVAGCQACAGYIDQQKICSRRKGPDTWQ